MPNRDFAVGTRQEGSGYAASSTFNAISFEFTGAYILMATLTDSTLEYNNAALSHGDKDLVLVIPGLEF